MSIVIVGGHDRMVCRYKEICKNFKCKAKVFTQMPGDFKGKIGNPDLMIFFTSTMSHKMLLCASNHAKKNNLKVERCHTSSAEALKNILSNCCG